jgi:DMSO/TMAO reductase YedYZ molybdopterin-dependent catalytic subunit
VTRRFSIALLLATLPLAAADSALVVAGVTSKDGVEMPALSLTLDDFAKLPHVKATVKEDKKAHVYEGVLVYEILKRAGQPFGNLMRNAQLVRYAIFRAHDGYRALFALPEFDPAFTAARTLVADRMDGKPIPSNRGPLRLIVPDDKDGARGVYMLDRIEIQGAAEALR